MPFTLNVGNSNLFSSWVWTNPPPCSSFGAGKIEKPKKADFRQRAHCNPLCDWGDSYPAFAQACENLQSLFAGVGLCVVCRAPDWLRFLQIMLTGRSIFLASSLEMESILCFSILQNTPPRHLACTMIVIGVDAAKERQYGTTVPKFVTVQSAQEPCSIVQNFAGWGIQNMQWSQSAVARRTILHIVVRVGLGETVAQKEAKDILLKKFPSDCSVNFAG